MGFSTQEIIGSGSTSQRVRTQMVDKLRARGIQNPAVLGMMGKLPRHLFIDPVLAGKAYSDDALPIGYGQTISQPYIVARMSEVLLEHLPAHAKILEIGTGSGYQAALLASLVGTVYSVERIDKLYQKTAKLIAKMGFHNIHLCHSDGGWGWAQHAPYDGIIATCAPASVPEELLLQLAIGARLVIPVGTDVQQLTVIHRVGVTQFERHSLEAVRFVPLVGGAI